jgi:hypothetical protein
VDLVRVQTSRDKPTQLATSTGSKPRARARELVISYEVLG